MEETREERKLEKEESSNRKISYVALAIAVVALAVAALALVTKPAVPTQVQATTTVAPAAKLVGYNIQSSLITPPMYLPSAPVITQQQPFGHRLTNINQPFNSTELSIINNAPNSYFETAGEMLLNKSIKNVVGARANIVPAFIVNGKPSVIYLGSITCLFCSENKWAMALALSRFGNFSALFKGYSSFGDGDLPTIYWAPANYNSSGTDSFGNFYHSNYINFISIDDEDPITQGFNLNPIPVIEANANATGNLAYEDAVSYIFNDLSKNSSTSFQGTPYTIWGNYQVGGADAIDLGNSMPTGNSFPLTNMTHEQVLAQLANPNDQFAWTEYAGADLYVAMVCSSINNTAPVCTLPAIQQLEKLGY